MHVAHQETKIGMAEDFRKYGERPAGHLILQNTQQLLRIQWQFTDLVQQERAVFGLLEFANSIFGCASE
jgi:hypothetical protein